MKIIATERSNQTHAASFRISEAQHREFVGLLETVPGSDVGSMYREIFARGLKNLQEFYTRQGEEKKGARP